MLTTPPTHWYPPSQLVLSRYLYNRMRIWVQAGVPEERCGLLAASQDGHVRRHFPIENILHSAARYQLDPAGQLQAMLWMEKNRLEQMVIYHSHPAGPSRLSATDLAENRYPEALYLLWYFNEGEWHTGLYWISGVKPIPIPLQVI